MNTITHYAFILSIPFVIVVHLLASPYTKVEESFSIQAIHDLLAYGIPLRDAGPYLSVLYDHLNFRQPVPRSFVGPIGIAAISRPWLSFCTSGEQAQILVRGCLGVANALALQLFQQAVADAFGSVAGYWYIIFQVTQFHVMYYASRTLPNTFAFALTTLSLRYLIKSNFGSRAKRQQRSWATLSLLTFAGVVLRGELAILVATVSASMLVTQKVSLTNVIIPSGMLTAAISLTITVGIDSIFWRSFPIWPEWVAFRFNALKGNSSNWGTSPWHFYFTSSIPKLLMNPLCWLVCIPTAAAVKSTRGFSLLLLDPLLAYVIFYGILPHKEWRFIANVVPGLTAVAASGASYIWNRRSKSWVYWTLSVMLVLSAASSAIASAGLLVISSMNYPGAVAIKRLHELAEVSNPDIYVRFDNLSRQTGATRFLQKDGLDAQLRNTTVRWHYDKMEFPYHLSYDEYWSRFDYVLEEFPDKLPGDWDVLEVIHSYAGFGLTKGESISQMLFGRLQRLDAERYWYSSVAYNWETWLKVFVTKGQWPRIKMEPMITILKHPERRKLTGL